MARRLNLSDVSPTKIPRCTTIAMPGLVKKLLVFATIDGLFLESVGSGRGVKIEYGTSNKITSTAKPEEGGGDGGFEVHGIIGINSSIKYLLQVCRAS